jgi:peroxiredoxin
MRYLKNLTYARKLKIEDAIFWYQKITLDKKELTTQLLSDSRLGEMTSMQLEALEIIRKEVNLSRFRVRLLVDNKKKITDFYESDGKAKENNK